jgi:hypothetical protein
MAVIVERMFTGGDVGGACRGVELFNEEIVRTLPFGNNWTKLRIAVLLGLGNAASITGVIDVGVCSASGPGVLSTLPLNYVGTGYGGEATRNAAGVVGYNTSGGYTYTPAARHYYAHHGGVDDFWFRDNVGTYYGGGNSLLQSGFWRRGLLGVDIEKISSIRCDVSFHGTTLATLDNDRNARSMTDFCEGSPHGTSNFYVSAFNLATGLAEFSDTSATPVAVTWADSGGPLDALNIAWNQTSCGLTVWGMAVSKYA